jgi:hypothetical protein
MPLQPRFFLGMPTRSLIIDHKKMIRIAFASLLGEI